MNDTIRFSPINEIEKKVISSSLEKILSKSNDIILRLYKIFTRGRNPSIYLISESLKQELLKFDIKDYLTSVGLYFGFIKKGRFFISLEAIEYLYKNKKLSDKSHLIVNVNGEKSVLYGNDVQKGMIVGEPRDLNEGDFLIILNENYELLAIALSKINYSVFQTMGPEGKIAKILVDKGSYLRRKQ